jgi:DNA-binding MarR family transcriptional regulator
MRHRPHDLDDGSEKTNRIEKLEGDDAIVANLERLVRHLNRRPSHRRSQLRILGILKEKGALAQNELTELLNVRSASASDILKKLELRGWISRKELEEDKRTLLIEITDEGQKVLENQEMRPERPERMEHREHPEHPEHMERRERPERPEHMERPERPERPDLLSVLSDEEKAQFAAILEKLNASLPAPRRHAREKTDQD